MKIRAVEKAFRDLFPKTYVETLVFEGREAESGVPGKLASTSSSLPLRLKISKFSVHADQPIGNEETKQGAFNRCNNCLATKEGYEEIKYIVGLEGGMQKTDTGYFYISITL